VITRVALALGIAWSLAPLAWLFLTSLKPDPEIVRALPLLPVEPTLSHYGAVVAGRPFARICVNSLVVAFAVTALCLGLAVPAAFALAKLRIRAARLILALVLAASMFPPIATVSPLFLLVRALGLRDTWGAVILAHGALSLPLALWIIVKSMRDVPDELIEAARVDGCRPHQVLLQVALPIAAPGVATAAILVFIASFNEFLFALTFTATEASRTLPVEIALFPGLHQIPWGDIAAAACLATAPPALAVLVFGRRIVAGLTAGATKG
jgi:multiple sugar transport system permease protein